MKSIQFEIPAPLRALSSGLSTVSVKLHSPSPTVGQALEALASMHPRLRGRIMDQNGSVYPFVHIFVSSTNIRDASGLETQIRDGESLYVLQAMAGG